MHKRKAIFSIAILLVTILAWPWYSAAQPQPQPHTEECTPPLHFDPVTEDCEGVLIPGLPERRPLPPPPGFTVLRPGGVREHADACPQGFAEAKAKGWKFCVDRNNPDPIPPLWAPPFFGIPYEEALKIIERNREWLMKLPGVHGVGISIKGISIAVDDPSVLPKTVEGLPVDPHIWGSENAKRMSHTLSPSSPQVSPIVSGIGITGPPFTNPGTLTALAYDGGFWLIYPSHVAPLLCGAPMVDAAGNLIGMVIAASGSGSGPTGSYYSYAIMASFIRQTLGFQRWSGPNDLPNNFQICQ